MVIFRRWIGVFTKLCPLGEIGSKLILCVVCAGRNQRLVFSVVEYRGIDSDVAHFNIAFFFGCQDTPFKNNTVQLIGYADRKHTDFCITMI